jgi:hypothetical protein
MADNHDYVNINTGERNHLMLSLSFKVRPYNSLRGIVQQSVKL